MTREEKIAAIYKEMANKELTFGCRCIIKAQEPDGEDFLYRLCRGDERPISEIKEIIGHPVMIGDVIKRIKEKREISYGEFLVKLLGQLRYAGYWKTLEASIDEQANECIDYVYSLIQKD